MKDIESVTDILRQAAEVVTAADLPADLRPAAFQKAVDLLSGTASKSGGKERDASSDHDGGGTGGDSDDVIQKVATKLNLDRELVDETFEVDADGDILLTIARAKLEASKTGGTKQIAVLLAAARQAAGMEDKTKADVIRAVAEDYGKYDSPNFSGSLNELGDYFSFSGTSRARELKVKRAGYEQAAVLITRLQS